MRKICTLYTDNGIEICSICQQKSSVQTAPNCSSRDDGSFSESSRECEKWVYTDLLYQECYWVTRIFFSSHQKELYGFRNKTLQKLARAQFPLMLSPLKNGVNKTQQLPRKAISIIVFYKDRSAPTSKDSNMQWSATKCHVFHQSFKNVTQQLAGASVSLGKAVVPQIGCFGWVF